jgi:hypothetical protein
MSLNAVLEHLAGLMPTVDVDDLRRLTEKKGDRASAAVGTTTTVPEHTIYTAERPGIVKKVLVTPEAQVPGADNVNYSTIVAYKRTAVTPGTAITFFSATTSTTASGGVGTIAAWARTNLTGFDSDVTKRTLAAGDVVSYAVLKTATTGVTFPAATVEVLVGELSD